MVTSGIVLIFAILTSAPDASSELDLVNDQLSEAQAQNRSFRSELSEAQRRVVDLESELAAVRPAERERAEEGLAGERETSEKRQKQLDRRKRKLDQRARSLRSRVQALDSREVEIAGREAAIDDQSGSAVLSGGGDASGESGCHPSYEGTCVPIVSDVDCLGGSGDGPEYVGRVTVVGPDVYDLDRDGDGVGCD